jgi:hypothetical protein
MTSDKTIAEKMHLKPGMTILVLDPPKGYLDTMGPLPENVRMAQSPEGDIDVVQIFVRSMGEFESQIERLRPVLKPSSIIWATYPKGTSGIETDLNRDIIWRRAKDLGMEASANFAVDEVWSAMRLKMSGQVHA